MEGVPGRRDSQPRGVVARSEDIFVRDGLSGVEPRSCGTLAHPAWGGSQQWPARAFTALA